MKITLMIDIGRTEPNTQCVAEIAARDDDAGLDLHLADHTFLQGHPVMVQVQSSWFPSIDRNPQRYVPNIEVSVATNS